MAAVQLPHVEKPMRMNTGGTIWSAAALVAGMVLALATIAPTAAAAAMSDVSALLRARQYAQALDAADARLKAGPDDPRLRLLKGLALTGLGRRDDAIALLTVLAREYPAMPEVQNNLGVLLAAAGRHDEARAALEAAIKANPSYARAHENLAAAHLQLAARSYATLLTLEPNNPEARAGQTLIAAVLNRSAERVAAVPAGAATAANAGGASAPGVREAEVLAAIQAWARAWSARDPAAYLAFYSPDFRTPGSVPRADWEAERSKRLKEASVIHVAVLAPQVIVQGAQATASFDQSYRSERTASSSRKTQVWEKRGNGWQIVREDSSR